MIWEFDYPIYFPNNNCTFSDLLPAIWCLEGMAPTSLTLSLCFNHLLTHITHYINNCHCQPFTMTPSYLLFKFKRDSMLPNSTKTSVVYFQLIQVSPNVLNSMVWGAWLADWQTLNLDPLAIWFDIPHLLTSKGKNLYFCLLNFKKVMHHNKEWDLEKNDRDRIVIRV